ncbi:hypothetical protein JCM10207_004856 [Rhodosporidiobolus poonsookiae]
MCARRSTRCASRLSRETDFPSHHLFRAAVSAQSIPPAPSTESTSSESASPTLSTSPLDSFANIHSALPTSSPHTANGHYRDDSYDSEADVLSGEEPQRRSSMDDADDAVKRYKENLYHYTFARFDRFKHDLERKQRTGAAANTPVRRSSSQ